MRALLLEDRSVLNVRRSADISPVDHQNASERSSVPQQYDQKHSAIQNNSFPGLNATFRHITVQYLPPISTG